MMQLTGYSLDDLTGPFAQAWSKAELMTHVGIDCPFDFTLPQLWLNEAADKTQSRLGKQAYDLILSTTVWAYPTKGPLMGFPICVCLEVATALLQTEMINHGNYALQREY